MTGGWLHDNKSSWTEESRLALLILTGMTYVAVFVVGFGGLWIENDTGAFSSSTLGVLATGSVLSPTGYPNGFAYQGWLAVLSSVTGLPVPTFNTVVMPFLGVILLVVSSYLAYRELTTSKRAAGLAVLIMLAVPDVMFTVQRGNHEKLNIAFIMGALYVLMKTYRMAREKSSITHVIPWLAAFYLLVWANASANDYFGSSFAAALTLTWAGIWIARRRVHLTDAQPEEVPRLLSRLGLVVAGSWILAWVFMAYMYPPAAATDLPLLHSAWTRVLHLFATFHTSSNPYVQAASIWASGSIYTGLSIFRWVLFLASLATWAYLTWQAVKKRAPLAWRELMLLALYTAFAGLVALSIPIDLVGLNAGTNLEVRNFTYFALLAAPVAAAGLDRILYAAGASRQVMVQRRRRATVLGVLLVVLIMAGTWKADLEPVVSNLWMFYHPAEVQAVRAFWYHSRNQTLWSGPDDRLADVATAWFVQDPNGNTVEGYRSNRLTRDFLVSPTIEADIRAYRVAAPWTSLGNKDLVYDNGGAQIFRDVPVTAFQH